LKEGVRDGIDVPEERRCFGVNRKGGGEGGGVGEAGKGCLPGVFEVVVDLKARERG
jgi:hypothetical protein